MEDGDEPTDRPVGVTCAVNGDGGYSQSSASPQASSECPCPGGRVSLEMAEDPCRDSGWEENRVDKRFRDEVKSPPYLGDGDVTATSRLLAVTLAFWGGMWTFPQGMVVVRVQEAFALEVSPLKCSRSGSVYVPYLV